MTNEIYENTEENEENEENELEQGRLNLNTDSIIGRTYEGEDITYKYQIELFTSDATARLEQELDEERLNTETVRRALFTSRGDGRTVAEIVDEDIEGVLFGSKETIYYRSQVERKLKIGPILVVIGIILAIVIGITIQKKITKQQGE